jgi:hypothetical protein
MYLCVTTLAVPRHLSTLTSATGVPTQGPGGWSGEHSTEQLDRAGTCWVGTGGVSSTCGFFGSALH